MSVHEQGFWATYWWLRELLKVETVQQFLHCSSAATAIEDHDILVTAVDGLPNYAPGHK